MTTREDATVTELFTITVKVHLETYEGSFPGPCFQRLLKFLNPKHLLLLGGPFLTQPN